MEHILDATDQKVGRLASRIAVLLQGKANVAYEPRLAGGDRVIVKNASKVSIATSKLTNKIYYHHTGYMGHLYEQKMGSVFQKSPADVLRRAVFNMLPRNRLRNVRLKRLTIEV